MCAGVLCHMFKRLTDAQAELSEAACMTSPAPSGYGNAQLVRPVQMRPVCEFCGCGDLGTALRRTPAARAAWAGTRAAAASRSASLAACSICTACGCGGCASLRILQHVVEGMAMPHSLSYWRVWS